MYKLLNFFALEAITILTFSSTCGSTYFWLSFTFCKGWKLHRLLVHRKGSLNMSLDGFIKIIRMNLLEEWKGRKRKWRKGEDSWRWGKGTESKFIHLVFRQIELNLIGEQKKKFVDVEGIYSIWEKGIISIQKFFKLDPSLVVHWTKWILKILLRNFIHFL